ncbi:mucin-2-like isoform X2 [Boleophthalmus pectinirostris]|uniref:mucin-2-like isoform X2 n=1 Tax=Boleophthalmus pectinirostris TaxID=150288 RepID=UPI002430F649|nr:mucin-2-like isoform X2 [Boleophthalmus pectinirostris]
MALSQIQCLDDNHVNPRTHESKPEFLYCEEQRHALETLLRDGREAFFKQLEERGLRGFLSDLELEALAGTVEPFDPGVDLYREDPESEDQQTALSLHYWPDLSDMSIPELDMGWPDSEAYRGVTRTTVYTQPPLEGQTHIKEVIRKMIAQAQKVIAVVMDVFTDVDIFRDLLDISFKKKVSVYILLDRASVPHFLSMVQRANMHSGHLKNLRVRYSGGSEFYTHSCTKVRGRMGHRFMFIDGDKAVSGSYSFTWMSTRLDRNLITVVTGQAVEAFDRLFRFLYTSSSRLVNLRRLVTEPEPEPDPVPQPASVPTPSAEVARKLYNPKYALVAAGNASVSPASTPGNNSPKESQKDAKNEEATKKRCKRKSKDTLHEGPPLHPGLVDLEKVYLFDYLPTWPEPDPPSDVIGFINIRDTSKPTQVHLQRSEMFEVSQAIRFSSPFNKPKEALPEVAKPRNLSASKHDENSAQPQQKTHLDAITPKTKNLTQSVFEKENAKAPGRKTSPQSPVNKIHSATPNLHTPPSPVKTVTTPAANAGSPKTAAKTNTQTTTLNSKSALQNMNAMETNHAPKVLAQSDSNLQIKTQKHNSNENTSPAGYIPVTSTSASANYQVSQATTVHSTLTSTGPALTTISTSASKLNTNSPIAPSPPIPKPRTVQLVIKDSPSDGQKIPEVSLVKKADIGEKVSTVDNETPVAVALTPKETEKVPELVNKSGSKSIPPKSTEDTAVKNHSQEQESKTSLEVRRKDAGAKAELQLLGSSKEMEKTNTEVSKDLIKAHVNNDKDAPKKNEVIINLPKGSSDFLENKPEGILITRNSDVAKVQNQAANKVGQSSHDKVSIPQKITYSSLEENRDILNSPTNKSPVLKMKSESIPTVKVEAQGDILKVDESATRTVKSNSRSPSPSPKVPKKPSHLQLNIAQTTDLLTSDKESRTRTYSGSEENKDLLKSPTNRSPILKTKSESIPTIKVEAPGDILKFNENVTRPEKPNSRSRSPSPQVPKKPAHLQLASSTTSDQQSLPRISYSSSEENINVLHSPTNRSPILIKKSENTPTIAAETQSARSNSGSPSSSPKVPKKPAHLLLNISQSSEENINFFNFPNNKSPVLKKKSENTPIIAAETQGDILKVDESVVRFARSNSRSRSPSPKVPKKPAHLQMNISQTKDLMVFDDEPQTRTTHSGSEKNTNLLHSPTNRSPVLKMKSESIPTIASETQGDISKVDESAARTAKSNNRSPLVSPKVPKKPTYLPPNISQTKDLILNNESQTRTTYSSSEENILHSPTKRSPVVKTKPENIPTITAVTQGDTLKADESLAKTAKSNNRSPLQSPKLPKKPAHLLLSVSQSSEENINLFNSPNNKSPVLKKKSENTPTIAAETQADISKVDETLTRTAQFNNRSPVLSPRVPKKPAQSNLNSSQTTTDSTTSEKESRSLLTQRNSPLLDGFPLRIPTPDSRRSRTPEFRTPTSDISDGCGSTTSDEFYECSDSPFRETIDQVPFYSLDPLEDKDNVVNSRGSYKEQAAMLSNDRTMSSSETLNLSNKGSQSSILEKMDDEEKLTKKNIQEREAIRKLDDLLDLQELVNQAKSNVAPNQSVVVEQSLTPKLNNEAAEAKRTSARELKPKKVYSRAEKPDKMPMGGEKTGLGTSGVERREAAPTANKEPEGHKQQQRDSTAQVQTRLTPSTRSSRPLSANQSIPARTMAHQRKMSDGNVPVLDLSSSPTSRKVPPKPPAPKPILNQHYRQPPTSPAKPKLAQTPNSSPLPKPQSSFLYTHAQNMQQRHSSLSQQSPDGAIPVGHDLEEEKTAFGISFSKLYTLKGLKDKMSKLPTQSRRSSTSGSAQQRKSTG